VLFDWGYFPHQVPAFPPDLLDRIHAASGLEGSLGHCHASGTVMYRREGLKAMGLPYDDEALAADFNMEAVIRGFQEVSRKPYDEVLALVMSAPDGTHVPLIELADINYVRGPQMIKSEDTFLIGYVTFGMKDGWAEVDVVTETRERLRSSSNINMDKLNTLSAAELAERGGISVEEAEKIRADVAAFCETHLASVDPQTLRSVAELLSKN